MLAIFSVDYVTLIAAAAIAAVAGVVRGITGFGGAMVMAPPLALLLGPKLAVPVIHRDAASLDEDLDDL